MTSTRLPRHRHTLAILLAAVFATAPGASAQVTPTTATLTEWDIFAVTGGTDAATQNISSVVLDAGGAAGPAGSVWLTGEHPLTRLGRLDPAAAGDNYLEWRPITDADSAGAARGLAVNASNGDVWFTMQGDPSVVLKVGGTNTFRRFRSVYPLVPYGVAVAADHAAIIAVPGRNSIGIGNALVRVPRSPVDGVATLTIWNVGGQPRSVAVDNAGDVWFTQRMANAVARLDLGTGELTEWTLPSGSLPAGVHVDDARVCVASEGMLNTLTGSVHCLDSQTNVVTTYARTPGDGFDLPQRAAFNADGEPFVTEQNANAISFVGAAARATAASAVVTPTVRTVLPTTWRMVATDTTVVPTVMTVTPATTALTGVDNGFGFVRFALPVATLTYPFPMPGYPQPVDITPVFNDRGRGTGAVFFGEYFNGPILGLRAGGRVGRLELAAPVTSTTLVANPTSLRFDVLRDGEAPGAQALSITEATGAAVSWTATEGAAWLTLSASSGTTPASIAVSASQAALAAGTYVETIVVDDGPGGAEPRSVEVTLNVLDGPAIELSPAGLTFAAVAGGTAPPAKWFSVVNSGGGTLDWTAVASEPWVVLDRTSGIAPSSLSVTIDPTTLNAGTRTATVTVSSPSAPNSPQTVAITVDVSSTGPALSIAPATLAFEAIKSGSVPAARTLTVANAGGGTLVWSASSSAAWLQVAPASGTATPSEPATLTVTVDPAGLARGTYSGTIAVSDPAATGSPATIPVTLTVRAATIDVSDSTLSFVTPAGSSPAATGIVVTNTGDATLTFTPAVTTSSGGSWLSVTPAGQSTIAPGGSLALNVSIDAASLPPGVYSGTIAIADPAATNTPAVIAVSLEVADGPFIGLTPGSLSFAVLRGRNPASQAITVANTGNATLNFAAAPSSTGGWLSVTPASGSVAPGGTVTLTAVVSSSGLASGTYAGSISVSDPAARNTPQAIAVSLTVMPAGTITLLPSTLTFTGARWTTCNGVESGEAVASQALTIGNSGDGALNYAAVASGGAWLAVTPAGGTVMAGGTAQLDVSVDLRGLARGTYTGVVTVSDPNATNLSQSADVTLTVGNAAATLCVTPTSMDFGTIARNSTAAAQILQILNVGDEPMAGWNATWTASRGTVNLSSSNGASPTSIDVSVSTTNVRGSQTGTITITAGAAGNSPVTVNLTWTVQ